MQVLAGEQGDVQGLEWYRDALLTNRNSEMLTGITKALECNPGKTLFVGVGALHFPDVSGAKGLLKLLEEDGFTVERLNSNTKLPGSASDYAALGAGDQGQCFAKPSEIFCNPL